MYTCTRRYTKKHNTIAAKPEKTPIEMMADDDRSFPLYALALLVVTALKKLGKEVGSIEGSSVGSRVGS